MSDTAVRVARPSRPWELATFVLTVSVIAAGGLGLVLIATDLAVAHYVSSGGVDGISPFVTWVIDQGGAISALYTLLYIGSVIGYVVWRRRTRTMLTDLGLGDRPAPGHWAIRAWQILLIVAVVGSVVGGPPEERESVATALVIDAVLFAVRVAGLTFLLIGIYSIRDLVRAMVATTVFRPKLAKVAADASDKRPTALPDRPAATGAGRTLTAADDDFWQQVRRTASAVRADLALLETTPAGDRRWLLAPAGGELPEVASGATVTVFPDPPEATETRGFRPAPADEYHGLLEDPRTGSLTYELVTARKVGAFLSRARSARRWALYRSDDPGALTAC